MADGTAAGTVLLADINPGSAGSNPTGSNPNRLLTNVNGTLFFRANDGTHGTELWKSDGTAAGTVLVKDIYPGSASSSPDGGAVGGTCPDGGGVGGGGAGDRGVGAGEDRGPRGELVQGITGIPYYYRQFGYEMALDLGGGRMCYAPQIPELKA